MMVNLHGPYGPGLSGAKENMVFYNKTNDNFMFNKGDKIEIYVVPSKKTMKLNWKLKKNLIEKPVATGYAECLPAYVFKITIDEALLEAGYYEVECEAEFGTGATTLYPCSVKNYCTFGYDAENIKNFVTKPDDFDEFWAETLKKIEGVDLQPEFGEVHTFKGKQIDNYNVAEAAIPCNYDEEGVLYDEVISYKVSFMSAEGVRIHGWFARPKAEGKYPGLMIYPGGGYYSRSMPLEHARHGYAALDINVHGQEIDLHKDSYGPTDYATAHDDICDYKNYQFRRIYAHAVQALNMLCSLDGVDKEKIAVCGGSQGGRLSVVAAALDERVKAAAISIPHHGGEVYRNWTQEVNKKGEDGKVLDLSIVDAEVTKAISYYDLVNFAPKIKCPVLCGYGLIDRVSPATCVRVLYNAINSEKEIMEFPAMAHDWNAHFDRYAWKWLKKVL